MKRLKLKSCIAMVIIAIAVSVGFMSCEKEKEPLKLSTLNITGVIIPPLIETYRGAEVTVKGNGFEMGDILDLKANDGTVYTITVTAVSDNSVTFIVPAELNTGLYAFSVTRGDISESLSYLNIVIIANLSIPDVAGKNIKGVVYCGSEGVADVVVSDGFDVTVTDENGIYYLSSAKENGYVFISVPSGYEAPVKNGMVQFFAYLTQPQTAVEQKDFSLVQSDQSEYTVLAMADLHLANRNNDISQFELNFLAETKAMCAQYSILNRKIYGITLGDMSWELYWYQNSYALPEYINAIKSIGCPLFNTIGNHDNDPYFANDWLAEKTYKTVAGPTYYSFNIGEIHYVVLDNVEYINEGGSIGIIGDRNYNQKVVTAQIEWLKKDLATVTDKTAPVIVAMHCPLYSVNISGENQTHSISLQNGTELKNCFSEFSTVHYLTGHTHLNYNVSDGNTFEHNTGAVCATWWWTGKNGYAGNHICKDGEPGGYGVYEISGRNIKWYYKSIGYPKEKQFRTYDRNTIHITAEKYTPHASDTHKILFENTYAGEYKNQSADNYILINIWNYDPNWNIEVKEGETVLPVTRISTKDPLHIISYEAKRFEVGQQAPTSAFVTNTTTHMFRVQASSPESTINIKVTDGFGNEYTETMTRPKEFSTSMQ
ncbi:MAG: calcineurin-like phosphoesterase C-terminal domain-containing protein [Prevotellaceae bacterium]|nr:calcineurin-like phosphoesterase C-terminal domain-containing protein [Prevotellaceae bacterium]